jgi:hypothetical protein
MIIKFVASYLKNKKSIYSLRWYGYFNTYPKSCAYSTKVMNTIIKEAIKILVDRLVEQIENDDYRNSKGVPLKENKSYKELLKYFETDFSRELSFPVPKKFS